MSDTERWYKTADVLPPKSVPVKTRDSDGNIQTLKRGDGRWWWTLDGNQCAGYTPVSWRNLQGKDVSNA